jgi:hypothetical protein
MLSLLELLSLSLSLSLSLAGCLEATSECLEEKTTEEMISIKVE